MLPPNASHLLYLRCVAQTPSGLAGFKKAWRTERLIDKMPARLDPRVSSPVIRGSGAAPLRQSEDRCAIVSFHNVRRAQPVFGLFQEPGSRAPMASWAMAFAFSVLAGPAQRCAGLLFDGWMSAPPASRNKGPRSSRPLRREASR
jgi:hypothetical protein